MGGGGVETDDALIGENNVAHKHTLFSCCI